MATPLFVGALANLPGVVIDACLAYTCVLELYDLLAAEVSIGA